mmetsp:Transcript_23353/g.59058  ORF Transcript_23353/g.59058 Transcript_23353/m.59058 type:complete len:302 (+) Transcript_23353:1758-2663(+)
MASSPAAPILQYRITEVMESSSKPKNAPSSPSSPSAEDAPPASAVVALCSPPAPEDDVEVEVPPPPGLSVGVETTPNVVPFATRTGSRNVMRSGSSRTGVLLRLTSSSSRTVVNVAVMVGLPLARSAILVSRKAPRFEVEELEPEEESAAEVPVSFFKYTSKSILTVAREDEPPPVWRALEFEDVLDAIAASNFAFFSSTASNRALSRTTLGDRCTTPDRALAAATASRLLTSSWWERVVVVETAAKVGALVTTIPRVLEPSSRRSCFSVDTRLLNHDGREYSGSSGAAGAAFKLGFELDM